jgi:hypothetical protein
MNMSVGQICCIAGIATGAVCQAVMSPKAFIPSFLLGLLIGSVTSIAIRHFSQKAGENPKSYIDLKMGKIKQLEPLHKLLITLSCLGGSTMVKAIFWGVELANPAVPPFVPFLSGSLSLITGLGLGVVSGYYISTKAFAYFDKKAMNSCTPQRI